MSGRRRLRTRYQGLDGGDLPPPVDEEAPAPSTETEGGEAGPVSLAEAPPDATESPVDAPPPPTPRRRFYDARTPTEGPVIVHMRPVPARAPAAPAADAAPAPSTGTTATATPAGPRWQRLRGLVRVRGVLLMIGLPVLAFATGVVVFNNVVMPRLIHGAGQVEVPDLSNLTLEQAEQSLRPLGLQLARAGERFDPTVPRGFVLGQEPVPGTMVRGKRKVQVVVSMGEEYSSVPELFGESQRSAEQLLRSAGLRVGAITRAPSEEVGAGMVAGSDPGPESVLPRDGIVSLLISSGSSEQSYVMPDLLGREVRGARRQLERLGFEVATPGRDAGTVVSQRPAPGARITRTTRIVLQPSGRVIR